MRRKTWTKTLVGSTTLGLSTLLVLGVGVAQAQVNSAPPQQEYAVIQGITGDSTSVHGAIDVQNLDFAVSVAASITSGGTGQMEVGRPSLSPISFSKSIDSATPQLLKAETTGKVLTGDIYFANTSAEGKPSVYYDLHFTGVITSDEQTDAIEKVAIQPQQVNITYTNLNQSGANLPYHWGFNVQTGQTI